MATKKQTKKILQGGNNGGVKNDIVLSQPEIFHFNMANYMSAITSASSIDFSRRTMLYNLYESTKLDLHLMSVLDKRLRAVTRFPIEFWRNGEADDIITPQLKSPWFKSLRKDLLLSEFWGYSLLQFYLDEDGWIQYESINRKHYDPVKRILLRQQGDQEGVSVDKFENMLFVGGERSLGVFAQVLPAVLYKRANMADWAKFANIFGMPVREYTYDAGDEETRLRLIADARNQGSNAVYIHPKDSDMRIVDSAFKASSANIFENFTKYWDEQISVRILGNSLTTQASDTGTQALGTVHKEEENTINDDDRNFILDILNYHMKDIFENLGFNVQGGEFVYAKENKPDLDQQLRIVQGLNTIGLPMDDDWLYQTFGIDKPANYDEIIAQKEAQKQALQASLANASSDGDDKNPPVDDDKNKPQPKDKKNLVDALRSFFGLTARPEADEW